jgi:hypothetical protein
MGLAPTLKKILIDKSLLLCSFFPEDVLWIYNLLKKIQKIIPTIIVGTVLILNKKLISKNATEIKVKIINYYYKNSWVL